MADEPAERARLNNRFGGGIFRRRLRLVASPREVRAALEDTNHAMRIVLSHDGERVTGIESVMTRIPISTCPGAAMPLRAFVGSPLAPYPRRPSAAINPRANCTHLHHLALLAIAHATRGGTRQYDVEVPDEYPDPVWSSIGRDGLVVHRWRTFEGKVLAPAEHAGQPLGPGFARWAAECFDGDDLEAAFVFSNAYLVSFSRRFDIAAWTGEQPRDHRPMHGKCYSYLPEVMPHGRYFANTSRDTTAADTPLLAELD